MVDQYTEVSSEGWFSRIGGAVKGMLFGLLLFLISFPLLFWNEGRAVRDLKRLEEGAAATISIEADKIDPNNEGKLVHFSAVPASDDVLTDEDFHLSVKALKLERAVEMFQWKEEVKKKKKKKYGGSEETVTTYSYDKTWSDRVISSSSFNEKHRAKYPNPTSMPFSEKFTTAPNVTLGAFKLTPSQTARIINPSSVTLTADNFPDAYQPAKVPEQKPTELPQDLPDDLPKAGDCQEDLLENGEEESKENQPAPTPGEEPEKLPEPEDPPAPNPLAGQMKVTEGGKYLFLGNNPANPEVGDARIWFTKTEPKDVTIIGQQSSGEIKPWATEIGGDIFEFRMGKMSKEEVFAAAKKESKIMTWILRGCGALAMFTGIMMILKPISVVLDVLPFLGNIAERGLGFIAGLLTIGFSLITIAIAWLFYRPIIGVPLLVVGIGALVLLKMRGGSTKQTGPPLRAD